MITTIREGSKAIIQYVLDEAIQAGNITKCVIFNENEVAKKLDFKSSKLFSACIQYLGEKQLIRATRAEDNRYITLTVDAIDFLES